MFHDSCLPGALNSGVSWIFGTRRVTTIHIGFKICAEMITYFAPCMFTIGHIWMPASEGLHACSQPISCIVSWVLLTHCVGITELFS